MNAKDQQKERSHESILASASRLVRERGIAGARVAEVMKGAGLTVGGFYAHFASKEALVDDVLRRAAEEMRARLFEKLPERPEQDLLGLVLRRYLTPAHRDAPLVGCPMPAVVGEIGTTASEHAPVLAEIVQAMAAEMEAVAPATGDGPSKKHLALGLIALMVGGLSLARALAGTPLSDEVLKACRAVGLRAAAAR
jgi:TetR/AcrR family transcriptional regulator, transcriptional repressor for nem operon